MKNLREEISDVELIELGNIITKEELAILAARFEELKAIENKSVEEEIEFYNIVIVAGIAVTKLRSAFIKKAICIGITFLLIATLIAVLVIFKAN